MAVRSPETIQLTGTAPTYHAASSGGDKLTSPGDNLAIHVQNDSASAITVTVVTPGTVIGQAIEDVDVSVPAGEARFVGPLSSRHFANADNEVDLSWSATASVTFAAIKL